MSIQASFTMERLIRAVVRMSPLILMVLLTPAGQALAAPPETMSIWRIQIFFETFNTPHAGSDDSVRVELRSNNATYVDSPLDDWEVGSRTYDLRLDEISTASDIDYLRVSKTGSDGWCIGRIRLIVNGAAIYDEQFPSGHWLDNEDGHSKVYFIDDLFMRQRSEWINYLALKRPNVVPVGDMKSRIQCLFGDFLTQVEVLGFGNSNPITIWTLDANTWGVNVALEDNKPWPVPDPDVPVYFELTVAWRGGPSFVRPDMRVENLNVGGNWTTSRNAALGFMDENAGPFEPRLNEMMKAYSYRIGTGIQLASNGDLQFIPISVPPPPIDITKATAGTEDFETTAVEIPADRRRPLGFRVRTGGDIEASAEMAFIATVASGFSEDSEVDVIFSLPTEILIASPAIEVNDGVETRWLAPQIETRDGGTLVTLRDRIASGKQTHYQLRLVFQPGEEKVAQIITRVVPASEGLAAEVRALEAATSFRFKSGLVSPEGTIWTASRAGAK